MTHPEAIKAVPVRHPGRWVAAVIVLAATAGVVYQVATAPNLHWDIVQTWFLHTSILQGLVRTLVLTVVAMVGAHMVEIVRAGIISVEHGQTEAAQALGMTSLQVMRRIVLPQAMRVIIPPTGNEAISMLKTSSLASVTQFGELFRASELISAYNYRIIELLIVISIWYLICTSVLTVGQYYLERYFGRGASRELPPTPLQRFRRMLVTFHAPPVVPAGAGR